MNFLILNTPNPPLILSPNFLKDFLIPKPFLNLFFNLIPLAIFFGFILTSLIFSSFLFFFRLIFTGSGGLTFIGFAMINGTLSLPAWLGGASVAMVAGWIVIITTVLGVILKIIELIK